MSRTFIHRIVGICLMWCLLPGAAAAQSQITGVVTDASGGVLPGVTIEAASPVLIEKVRTAVADAEGRYAIINLRPGTYAVTFTLAGFSPFVRELILPADFTATVNAELRVGTLAETITVTGAAPVVDVESTQRTTVLERELVDSLPTGRTFQAIGALVVGIRVSEVNVGGARSATNQRLTAYGSLPKDTTIAIDGMKANSTSDGGDDQADHNDGMTAEFTVQTSGLPAEVARGGPHVNLIPREGGNTFGGRTYFGYTNGSMQSDNLGDLPSRGLRTPDSVDKLYYANAAVGGPILRDRLWFFAGYGDNGNNNIVANSFYPDGRPGIYDQRVRNYTARLTWQVTPKNKFSVLDDFAMKFLGHDFLSGVDVATASTIRPPKQKYTFTGKWTSTVTNTLLLEAGVLGTANTQSRTYQPGVAKAIGTPEWYAHAPRVDLVRGTTTTSPAIQQRTNYVHAYLFSSSVTYVTGSHQFKSGVQWGFGHDNWDWLGNNADLVQRYRDGVPDSVIVWNTPTQSRNSMNADVGFFVQDSWRVTNRLTVSPGLRFEYLNSSIEGWSAPAGRFVGPRQFPRVPDLPNWFNVAPRFGVVYDLTGDARTALKGTVNRYNRNFTTDLAARYDPLFLQSDTRNWSDCDYVPGTSRCSGRVLPTNGDNIAQDNEIGPSNNRTFAAAPNRRFDPDSRRPYDVEYTIGVEREVGAGIGVTATWFRRESYDLEQTINTLVDVSDYAAFQVPSPLNSELVTIYNLNPAKQGLVDLLDTTADRSKARFTFTGFELTMRARLPNGGSMYGGWSAGQAITVACANLSDPNTFRYCDQSELGIPYRHGFKISGSYPLPLGLVVGASAVSNAGHLLGNNVTDGSLNVIWAVPANLFPGGRTQPVSGGLANGAQLNGIRLVPPGSQYLKRWNQLDVQVKRLFNVGTMRVEPGIDVYNVFNSNVVLVQNQNFGGALGRPDRVLQGRLLRVTAQIIF